jgi:hypothetical protein
MTISDTFGDFTPGLSSPICGGFDIVPDDAVDLQNVTRAIVLPSGGDVSVVLKNGDAITLPALTAGVISMALERPKCGKLCRCCRVSAAPKRHNFCG